MRGPAVRADKHGLRVSGALRSRALGVAVPVDLGRVGTIEHAKSSRAVGRGGVVEGYGLPFCR